MAARTRPRISTIGTGGQYLLSGGTLTINGSLINNGTIDGGNGAATLAANCLVDLTSGRWKNYANWSVNIGSHRAGDRARRIQPGDRFRRRHHRRHWAFTSLARR